MISLEKPKQGSIYISFLAKKNKTLRKPPWGYKVLKTMQLFLIGIKNTTF